MKSSRSVTPQVTCSDQAALKNIMVLEFRLNLLQTQVEKPL